MWARASPRRVPPRVQEMQCGSKDYVVSNASEKKRILLLTSDHRTCTPLQRILLRRSEPTVKSIRITPEAEKGSGKSVSFVLAIGSTRQACVLKTTFKTQSQALSYLQKHRTALEVVARAHLERGEIEDGIVQLAML